MSSKNLIIVESPSKIKTLKKFLGNEYEIDPKFSDMKVGHRRNISKSLDNDLVFSIVRIK